jgi:hypothetical protein
VGRLGSASAAEENKAMVRRLVDEVINGDNMGALDELFGPGKACRRR